MPKLILYPHSSAIGNRVYDNYYNFKATFTTTPLYHGGIADFMRLLMAYSTLWLYPSTMPITSKNMFKALSICQSPRAYYFSSVPYVLEVCAGDAATVHKLIGMDMVGVGGAPLEEDIGNFLVKKGVKLVSRFGTSECGFLMSSYRSFQVDQEWDYLRSKHGSAYEFISLGTRGFDGEQKFELEVLSTWPQMNCQPNTPRGRYATGDLFVRHPLVTEAYKHVGRRDTLIALSNGKKLDPTVIERALEESELALESFVFGNGRPFPGILVFPSTARNVSREEIFKVLGEKNAGTNIMPDMIVFPPPYLYPLRSSKGQIMRQTTLEIFKKDIEKAYKRYELEVPFGERLKRDNFEKLGEFVRSVVMEVIGEKVLSRKQPLGSTTDLFRYGVDSITAVHIRNRLLKGVEIDSSRISQYVVYEQTSIAGTDSITRYLFAGGDGGTAKEDMEEDLMRHLVRKYDAVDNSWVLGDIMAESETPDEVVLLTGATGSLGRHIAKQIVTERPDINKLYCLCRPESEAKMEALIGELHRIAPSGRRLQISSVVENLDLAGIGKVAYDDLREATIIIHAAWSVNFLAPLSSFESPDISSVQQLLRLARQCKRKACFVFCSSIASHSNQWSIRQSCSDSPSVVDKLGYSRSKWVAEKICENAALAGQTVAIIRIGQLSGDTVDGAWNHSEGWPMMIGSLSEVGCLPDFEQKLSWLPVDLAARGVLDIAGSADRIDTMPGEPVFNLGNMDISTSWSVVLDWLKMAGAQFERVSPQQWLEKIEKLEPGARSRKLFPIWQAMVFAPS
ncbi:hypothetical protein L873DRAFT_1882435 [Choiromyces venosus 120613-1]|uniref:Carrier domain-containing protein n=1 Tax=Choiromyces venosus 120613-1 TaxID=1336337 RepID=A0A3N4K4S7_9PEZI|nr:hypothetical protein L873DRAFT_1882435 [Choiromyces venosus 120613-1]